MNNNWKFDRDTGLSNGIQFIAIMPNRGVLLCSCKTTKDNRGLQTSLLWSLINRLKMIGSKEIRQGNWIIANYGENKSYAWATHNVNVTHTTIGTLIVYIEDNILTVTGSNRDIKTNSTKMEIRLEVPLDLVIELLQHVASQRSKN